MSSCIFLSLILPKCAKTRELKTSVVYLGAPLYMLHLTPRQL